MPAMGELEKHDNQISFVLNGEYVSVENADPKTCLGDYLRNVRGLKGLQMPCRQGGCGACTVLLSSPEFGNAATNAPVHRTINSCLRPLCSVDGMVVTTIEGVGSIKKGLHPVQEELMKSNGSQCGGIALMEGFQLKRFHLDRDDCTLSTTDAAECALPSAGSFEIAVLYVDNIVTEDRALYKMFRGCSLVARRCEVFETDSNRQWSQCQPISRLELIWARAYPVGTITLLQRESLPCTYLSRGLYVHSNPTWPRNVRSMPF